GDAGAAVAFEAGSAEHEKLIEIVGGNRQKPNTLEQGMGVGCRFLEDPAVELQPRQLTIDEPFRARDQLEGGRSLGAGRNRGRPSFLFYDNDLAAVSHGRMVLMRSATSPSSGATHAIRPRHQGAVKAQSRAGFGRKLSWLRAACAAWPGRRAAPPPRAPPQTSARSAWPRSRSGLRRPRAGGRRRASPAPRARVHRRAA